MPAHSGVGTSKVAWADFFCKWTTPRSGGQRMPLPVAARGGWAARCVVALLLPLLLVGCASIAPVPMSALSYRADDAKPQRKLLVLLSGFGAGNSVFEEEGIVEEIRKRRLPFDVVAPNAHYGYYFTETFESRLKADIIDPARRQGYEEIWLAGFSMGGLGSLIYQQRYPDDVAGILLTSPFLGWSGIHEEIRAAGGLADWQPGAPGSGDWARELWRWVRQRDFSAGPPIWLGYGSDDHLIAAGPGLLADKLPADRVLTAPGGHSLSTFRTLFLRHLDTLARLNGTVVGWQAAGEMATPQPAAQ